MIVDAMLWATNKMDESLINPVATHLAGSVVNPAVLSFLLWDRLKNLTPQRARDLSRLVATAIANALGVLSAQRGQQLRSNTKRLRDEFVQAASSCIGRDVVLNSCAMAAKVAQAVSTPESKAATQQAFLTLQSVVDFFASDDGHRIVSSISECICSACEMAASPEASIFLAELATNLLHTLESEELRRSNSQQKEKTVKVNDRNYKDDIKNDRKMDEKHAYSPSSSVTDTRWSNDTESGPSAPGTPMTGMYASQTSADGHIPLSFSAENNSSYRSARIEKEVLLKMGVDSSMLVEIQRVLDVLAAEEEEKELRRREEAAYVASLLVPKPTEETAVKLDHGITYAFGSDENEATDHAAQNEDVQCPTPILPVWHKEPVREALRRRHIHAEALSEQRDPAERQAYEMAAVLAQRHIKHGELQPADVAACRVIAKMLVYSVASILLLMGFLLIRKLFM
ncbi:hypothetical protein Plhal304r1_c058g0145401 [Plasmopara halstedii]